jgi:hypothetical protein
MRRAIDWLDTNLCLRVDVMRTGGRFSRRLGLDFLLLCEYLLPVYRSADALGTVPVGPAVARDATVTKRPLSEVFGVVPHFQMHVLSGEVSPLLMLVLIRWHILKRIEQLQSAKWKGLISQLPCSREIGNHLAASTSSWR